ncbi:MAG: M20/M25/M40 family metallo-hydrolase [Gammaproteobacteria bacterium]|nr:M20/M25/M40 family metallo-hydrolase [Gammaproteobacteria bacterium]
MSDTATTPGRDGAFWIALVVLSVALLLAVRSLQPPDALPADAPEDLFSAGRAIETLRYLLGDETPHPVGSSANRAVRDRLIETLSGLGLDAKVQSTVGCNRRRATCANVENVLAEIPGETRDALVLMAHYDSVPHAPGAADDGSGVATLLETARVLMREPTPRNRILLVFTDAEEMGLLGAEGFFAEHPWVADVKAVINVEGGGSGGPSLLLRSSNPGGHLLDAFRDTASSPVAISYAQEVFARMPNDTDFTVPDRIGISSIDFAFAFEFNHYHTPLDTIDNLDSGSVQHHGGYVLPLARRLANSDLSVRQANFSYITIQQSFWITWPVGWTVPLAAIGLIGLLAATIRVRPMSTIRATSGGIGLALIATLIGMLACFGALWVADWIAGTTVNFPASPGPWRVLMGAGALLPVGLIAWWAGRRFGFWALYLGAWWWLGGLGLALAIAAPLAANLLVVPLLFASLSCVVAVFTMDSNNERVQNAVAIAAAAILAYPLMSVTYAMEQTQGLLLAPAIYASLVLVAIPLLPLRPGSRFVGATALAIVIGWVWVAFAPLYSEWRPQHLSLYYVLDHDERKARWAAVTINPVPDRIIDAFGAEPALGQIVPWATSQQFPNFDAAVVPLPAPSVTIERTDNNVILRFRSYTGGDFMQLALPASAGVSNLRVAGRPVEAVERDGFVSARFFALGDEELVISFSMAHDESVEAYIVDGSHTLPDIAAPFAAARGQLAVPQHRGDQLFAISRVQI